MNIATPSPTRVIELRCRAHNQLEAERDYGMALMATKRGHTKVSEVAQPYATTARAHFKSKPYREQSAARPTIYNIDAERLSSG